jgi:DNA-directed RNA polymerase I subunit RPA1
MANFTSPTVFFIGDVEFSRLSAEETKKISVKRIHVTPTFDQFQQPTPGGLHDPALGAVLDKRYGKISQNTVSR